MALEQFLIDLLVDPVDHESLLYIAAEDILFNPRRLVAYDVKEGIPVLLPDDGRAVTAEEGARLQAATYVVTGQRS